MTACKTCAEQRHKNWREKPEIKTRLSEYSRQWQKDNPEKLKAYQKEYYSRPETKKRWREKERSRWTNDPQHRLHKNMSRGIRSSLNAGKGGASWEVVVEYTLKDLRRHLEKQFQLGMTWDNYGRGGWHIDHIIPASAFNFESVDDHDFKRCWALKNLQPLWETENLKKNAKLNRSFQPTLALGS